MNNQRESIEVLTQLDFNVAFFPMGSVLSSSPNTIVVDVGNSLEPGVIDHHFPGAPYGCAASLLAEQPELLLDHIPEGTSLSEVTLGTHHTPDLDAVTAIFLARYLVLHRQLPEGVHELVAYVREVDFGRIPQVEPIERSLFGIFNGVMLQLQNRREQQQSKTETKGKNSSPTPPPKEEDNTTKTSSPPTSTKRRKNKRRKRRKGSAPEAVVSAPVKELSSQENAKPSEEKAKAAPPASSDPDAWSKTILVHGINLLNYVCLQLQRGASPYTEELFPPGHPYLEEEASIRLDYERYLRDYHRAKKHVLSVPMKWRPEQIRHVDCLFIDDPDSHLFKVWARKDRVHSSMHRGFTMLYVYYSASQRHIISVDPEADVFLKGLGDLLEEREVPKRKQLGQVREGEPRPGYHSPDPWYDGRGTPHNYTILANPSQGTVLSKQDVRAIILEYSSVPFHLHLAEGFVHFFYPFVYDVERRADFLLYATQHKWRLLDDQDLRSDRNRFRQNYLLRSVEKMLFGTVGRKGLDGEALPEDSPCLHLCYDGNDLDTLYLHFPESTGSSERDFLTNHMTLSTRALHPEAIEDGIHCSLFENGVGLLKVFVRIESVEQQKGSGRLANLEDMVSLLQTLDDDAEPFLTTESGTSLNVVEFYHLLLSRVLGIERTLLNDETLGIFVPKVFTHLYACTETDPAETLPEEEILYLLHNLANGKPAVGTLRPPVSTLKAEAEEWLYEPYVGVKFAFSRHGQATLTHACGLPNAFETLSSTVYCDQILFALNVRTHLMELSRQLSHTEKFTLKVPKRRRAISELRLNILDFTNRWYFRQLTHEETGHVIYKTLTQVFEIHEQYEEILVELRELDEYLERERSNYTNNLVSFVTMLFLPPATMAGILGMNIVQFGSGKPNLFDSWVWFAMGAMYVFLLSLWLWLRRVI